MELDTRGRRLRAALAALLVRAQAPELTLVHRWLDSWAGIGLMVVGMSHQGYQVSLGEHGAARWIAVFYRPGRGHEPVEAAGTAGRDGMVSGSARAWAALDRAWLAESRRLHTWLRSIATETTLPSPHLGL
jgi:hypothetical protein